ncbi:magnesium transporter [Aestuariispira insulae]|uniref:Magnesium transporter MgtE n=1 Tax=Aestuariispira insulae TaxID=1461337 RepID=A0A3D9HSZ0_9PROT|nr:magnesium transporter [Aestuariispira insulae]RED52535.1 Mg2+ transporter MgtE [Aestuariispira insulae]
MDATETAQEIDVDALDRYGLSEELIDDIEVGLLESKPVDYFQALLEPLHAADIADLLEQLSGGEREQLIELMGDLFDAEVYSHLDYTVREDVVEDLDTEKMAEIVNDLASDDAIDFLEDLDEEEQRELLDAIPAEDRAFYEKHLSYPDESAGRLMQREVVTVPSFWTVGQTIDHMRDKKIELPDDFYNLIIVDPSHHPVGMVKLSKLLRTKRPTPIANIMWEDMKIIPVNMDQEDAAYLFRQYGLVEAPVVEEGGRLVGVITVDDIVEVLDEEHEEDILKLGGVKEDDLYSDVVETTRLRFSWLLVNLGTAIAASLVIGLFETALEKVVALAILMPIVASMGGNAGTQTLTVAVRALATNELTTSNAFRIVGKEVLVGGINGILFAILMGLVSWAWFQDPALGGVIACAMVVNMLAAGLAGTLIPLGLEKLGKDPAIASTVFLTTITDVVGFFSFLGLAAWVLL